MDNPPELVDLVTFDRDLADTMLQQYPGLIFENQYQRNRLSGECRVFRLGKSTLLKFLENRKMYWYSIVSSNDSKPIEANVPRSELEYIAAINSL